MVPIADVIIGSAIMMVVVGVVTAATVRAGRFGVCPLQLRAIVQEDAGLHRVPGKTEDNSRTPGANGASA
ncbi:hypothetical protein PV326_009729 [Microctonus aethiopoides]|nr:hypothetical protein PV326_009729 [Microctonus aethiopoides]